MTTAAAGASERTIYKYAAKQRWKKRYRRTPDFAPVKGAGGRFIRREDKGLPFVRGLKATDPAGRKRAAAGCRQAKRLSSDAQTEAERQQRAEACIQAMDWMCRASSQLRDYLDARDQQQHPPRSAPDNHQRSDRPLDPLERVYRLSLTLALSRWEALLAEEEEER